VADAFAGRLLRQRGQIDQDQLRRQEQPVVEQEVPELGSMGEQRRAQGETQDQVARQQQPLPLRGYPAPRVLAAEDGVQQDAGEKLR